MTADERELLLKAAAESWGRTIRRPLQRRHRGRRGASYAGMYETVLNVAADGLAAATDRSLASAQARRVAAYRGEETATWR